MQPLLPRTALALITVGLLTSCGKQQDQPQVADLVNNGPAVPQEVKDDTTPSLKIESREELPFAAETKATIWELRGQKVKELTVHLLICTDGKADTNDEIVCRWEDTSKPTHAYLGLLVQDGQPFGLQGKRLPSLSLSFQSGAPSTKTAKSNSTLIPSNRGFWSGFALGDSSISGKQVLYAEGFKPHAKGEKSISLGTEDRIVESSKDGGAAFGVMVEWKQ